MDLAPLLHRRIADLEWVAFDTEATGFSNVSARLVEIAGVRFRFAPAAAPSPAPLPATSPGEAAAAPVLPEVERLSEFLELANPGIPIPAEVIPVHGITDDAVRDCPPAVEVIERFIAFSEGAVLLAHYVPFDLGAMTFALLREGRRLPRLAAVDTSILPKRLFPGARNYSLETLVQFLSLPAENAHRAMPDARSTLELFRRCVAALGDPATLTVGELCAVAGAPLTFEHFAEIPYELPAELRPLDEAIAAGMDLTLQYRGGSKGQGPRRVTPSHLFARDGALFLEGYCHVDRGPKSFRVDRIEQAAVLAVDPAAPRMRNKGSGHWVSEPAHGK